MEKRQKQEHCNSVVHVTLLMNCFQVFNMLTPVNALHVCRSLYMSQWNFADKSHSLQLEFSVFNATQTGLKMPNAVHDSIRHETKYLFSGPKFSQLSMKLANTAILDEVERNVSIVSTVHEDIRANTTRDNNNNKVQPTTKKIVEVKMSIRFPFFSRALKYDSPPLITRSEEPGNEKDGIKFQQVALGVTVFGVCFVLSLAAMAGFYFAARYWKHKRSQERIERLIREQQHGHDSDEDGMHDPFL